VRAQRGRGWGVRGNRKRKHKRKEKKRYRDGMGNATKKEYPLRRKTRIARPGKEGKGLPRHQRREREGSEKKVMFRSTEADLKKRAKTRHALGKKEFPKSTHRRDAHAAHSAILKLPWISSHRENWRRVPKGKRRGKVILRGQNRG